jgi:N-acetylglucosamine-6-phosphate deacetylase
MNLQAIDYATNQPISIRIDGGVIQAIEPLTALVADLPVAAPGLVDLQINGYAGHDFNSAPIAEGALEQATRLLRREGVTTFFPTVITNTDDAICGAMRSIARACETDFATGRGVAGIHLEGPFISPEDGPRGAHAREHVRSPDWEVFRRWQDASGGRIRIITLSPEWPDAPEFVRRCAQSGVKVSIGHTAATPEQIRQAVQSGARLSTHLGNGAHLMLPRHPNYLWEQLAQDELWTTLIADGFHLPDQVLKVMMKVKGERAMLISDAVALAGMPPGTYTTPVGGQVVLTPEGRIHLGEDEKLLAGSAQMLLKGIEHMVDVGLATLPHAWDMASVRPASFMNLPQAAGLNPGAPADIVLVRATQHSQFSIDQTYKAGQLVYTRASAELKN